MSRVLKQFTIRQLREPTQNKIEEDINWVCNSLGFISSRDQDNTAFRILTALIKASKKKKGMTSEELSRVVEPTIGSVIYHLKKLMKAGLVVKLDSYYELRMNSILATINEIHKEVDSALAVIKNVAKDVDNKLGLEHR